MSTDWQQPTNFVTLAELAQTADFRNDIESLRAVPSDLLRRAIETCAAADNAESAEAYRFVMNVVRGIYRNEPKAVLWLIEAMEATRGNAPELAFDAAIELLRLFQPDLRARMKRELIGEDSFKENPLGALEACYYPPEASLDDVLVGAFLNSAYRTVFMREASRFIAAIFAATRELYGYVRARQLPTALRCLDWCRSQSALVSQLNGDVREVIIESLLAAASVAADNEEDRLCEQILLLGSTWTPASGNIRANLLKELGLAHKRQGRLGDALRSLEAGARTADVDDEELLEELQLELTMIRAELEQAPERIQIPRAMLDGFDGAKEAMETMQAIMVRKANGERVADDEYVEVISAMHFWNQQATKLQIKAPVRLNQALLLLAAAMSMQDVRRSPVTLNQLIAEADALRSAADAHQALRYNMLRQSALTMLEEFPS